MTHEERITKMATELIAQSEPSMTFDEALDKVFGASPDLYASYREEALARKPQEEAAARPVTMNKTVGQLAVEGIAKQLLASGAAADMNEATAQAFQRWPGLYRQYRREGFSHLG